MRRGWTLIELLVIAAILLLLISIAAPSVRGGLDRTRSAKCAANLHGVGVLIQSFVQSHGDQAAPTVWGRDFSWDKEPRLGWDIETGIWAGVPGGRGTVWNCPAGSIPYVGNARALGVDERFREFRAGDRPRVRSGGPIYRVGPRWWHEPSRLALALDIQTNLQEAHGPFSHAGQPLVGDLSDELTRGWLKSWDPPFHALLLDRWGPHQREAYGVLFADGHVTVKLYLKEYEGVLWSGPRWWSD